MFQTSLSNVLGAGPVSVVAVPDAKCRVIGGTATKTVMIVSFIFFRILHRT